MPRPLLLISMSILLVALAAACGGGGSPEGNTPEDISLTDPASVPTSTPIAGDQVFLIRDNGISAPSGVNTVAPDDGGNNGGGNTGGYTVGAGETCGSIATAHDISTEALIAANPGINEGCTNLQVGQVLSIPGAAPTPDNGDDDNDGDGDDGGSATATPPPSGQTHTISSGDTCFDIAASYGVSTDDLLGANSGLDCNALQLGDVIQIP